MGCGGRRDWEEAEWTSPEAARWVAEGKGDIQEEAQGSGLATGGWQVHPCNNTTTTNNDSNSTEYLLFPQGHAKHFTCINSSNLHNNARGRFSRSPLFLTGEGTEAQRSEATCPR